MNFEWCLVEVCVECQNDSALRRTGVSLRQPRLRRQHPLALKPRRRETLRSSIRPDSFEELARTAAVGNVERALDPHATDLTHPKRARSHVLSNTAVTCGLGAQVRPPRFPSAIQTSKLPLFSKFRTDEFVDEAHVDVFRYGQLEDR